MSKRSKRGKRRIFILGALLVIAAGFLAARGLFARLEANLNELVAMEMSTPDLSTIGTGIYHGSYSMFPVTAEVKVVVQDHVITSIELTKHDHGKGVAAEVIPSKVVEAQSLQVDAVSGATYSSKVILKAIENAFANKGN